MATDPEQRSDLGPRATEPLRIMLVGDSKVVAERVAAALADHPEITISARVPDGVSAVSAIRRQIFDAIVLDIGDSDNNVKVTLTRLFKIDPDAKVVMVSTLTFANVKASMAGLLEGAAEFIPTPAAHTKITSESAFAEKLTTVLKAFGPTDRVLEARTSSARPRLSGGRVTSIAPPPKPIKLRPLSHTVPEVLAVGSSTGGPQALFTFIATLPQEAVLPILITQHMPATFTNLLAGHITKHSGRDCREGVDGEPIETGRIYLAPGDRHMSAVRETGGPRIRLTDDPPLNFCRPSVDPLFKSLATIYKARVMAVMLTGMGNDGLDGSQAIVDAGGTLIAQDEATSVVWGMPRAVAEAGLCSAVLPLDDLGPFVGKCLKADW